VSINLARIATTILAPLKSYKNNIDCQWVGIPRPHYDCAGQHAVARREPPLADARRNPSPGTALRSFLYNTPGRAANGGCFAIPLTFGEQADWFRNIQAAGGCMVRWKGVNYPLIEPEVVDFTTVRASFYPAERVLIPVIGIEHFVRLRHDPASASDPI